MYMSRPELSSISRQSLKLLLGGSNWGSCRWYKRVDIKMHYIQYEVAFDRSVYPLQKQRSVHVQIHYVHDHPDRSRLIRAKLKFTTVTPSSHIEFIPF